MDNTIVENISKNIKELRLLNGMKQTDLGEKISYSDKTISKWENATSSPDITALAAIADIFGVTIDDLIKPNAAEIAERLSQQEDKDVKHNDIAMLSLTILSLFTIAVILYVTLYITKATVFWQVFVWAVPPSALVFYRYNRHHFGPKWLNALFLSIFCWSLITSIYLQLLSYNIWSLFFLGVPLQPMIIISTLLKKNNRKYDV